MRATERSFIPWNMHKLVTDDFSFGGTPKKIVSKFIPLVAPKHLFLLAYVFAFFRSRYLM